MDLRSSSSSASCSCSPRLAAPARALAAGVLCGLIAANRPPDAILAGALGLFGLFWAGRRAPWLAAGAAVPLGLVLTYNLAAAGHLAGGYGIPRTAGFFHHGLLTGVAGLLFSPTRGLFVFSPFLLLCARRLSGSAIATASGIER